MANTDGGPSVVSPSSGAKSTSRKGGIIPCRIVLVLLGFFGFFNLYALRCDLAIAIVRMVNNTYVKQKTVHMNGTVDTIICNETSEANKPVPDGPFNWDTKHQGQLLAAFFYGYIFTQLPGGMLAERFGGKMVLLIGILWAALWTTLTPPITKAGDFAGLLIIRIMEGVGEGIAYPAMHGMLSNWAPELERSRMATTIYSGAQIGAVISMSVSGYLCEMVNWESVFYVFGATGLLWGVLWIFFVYDKPSEHPRISQEERMFIETSLGPQPSKYKTKPWFKMAISPAVWSLVICNFSHNWGNFSLLTVIPSFLSKILKFRSAAGGLAAAAPYLSMWMGMIFSGAVADALIARHILSTTVVRKLFVFLGFVIPALSLICLGYVHCNQGVAIFLLVMTGFGIGLSWAGWGVNHLDVAPPYAGTLFGISNCISTIPGFTSPLIVGALTDNNQTHAAWRTAFYIFAGFLLFGTAFFLIFGTGKRQDWSYPEESTVLPPEKAASPVPLKAKKTDEELGGRVTPAVLEPESVKSPKADELGGMVTPTETPKADE